MRAAVAVLAAAALCAGGGGCGAEPAALPPAVASPALALWSEFLSDAEVRAALPLLAKEGAALYLALSAARIGDPALAALLRDAAGAGVPVRAWLLLSEQDGYWANEHNASEVRAAALAFADWREAEALPVGWLIFDLEMALERSRAVSEAIEQEGLVAGLEKIKEGRDPASFAAHRQQYFELVAELQARGLRVMGVTYPMVLDDAADGDDDIQDELDVPIGGVPWDEASFMVYQSLIYDLSGSWHGPDVIYSYARSAVEQHGARAAVALGIVGQAGIDPVSMPYPDASTLLRDHAAARAGGAGSISIYSLDGLLQQDDPGAWLDAVVAPVVPEEGDAEVLRGQIRGFLDG
ncbi:MAG: hypothetical protein HY744_06735 [Deltaproteobacteria bacterium]|nr:hypothetical protein [Deltaproteobacteria bacterium]